MSRYSPDASTAFAQMPGEAFANAAYARANGFPAVLPGESLESWLNRIYPGTHWHPPDALGNAITAFIEGIGGKAIGYAASILGTMATALVPGVGGVIASGIDGVNATVQAGLARDEAMLGLGGGSGKTYVLTPAASRAIANAILSASPVAAMGEVGLAKASGSASRMIALANTLSSAASDPDVIAYWQSRGWGAPTREFSGLVTDLRATAQTLQHPRNLALSAAPSGAELDAAVEAATASTLASYGPGAAAQLAPPTTLAPAPTLLGLPRPVALLGTAAVGVYIAARLFF